MIRLIRTDSSNNDFRQLVAELDVYLAVIDGDDHAYYAQYNKTGTLPFTLVAYKDDMPVGCGAIREYDAATMEVKRMYVKPVFRGKGIASSILQELENWSRELHYLKCILETGKKQEEAIALYIKKGYHMTPNYGQYEKMDNSVCFEKVL